MPSSLVNSSFIKESLLPCVGPAKFPAAALPRNEKGAGTRPAPFAVEV
jgi:hypothetical protein